MPAVQSPALLTDLYQLTMAYGYWKADIAEREAVFHLTFRRHPFKGRYTVACGLGTALELLEEFRFDSTDIEYLASLVGSEGKPLFEPDFLSYLGQLRLSCDIHAIPEGTLVFSRRTASPRKRPGASMPAPGNPAPQHHQFPKLDRHQGLPRRCSGRRRLRHRVWSPARARPRRRPLRQPRRLRRRMLRHLKRPRRQALRHPRPRDPRTQLGDDVRLRGASLHRVGEVHA